MTPYKIVVLPGDGIGPEIMTVCLRVLRAVESNQLRFDFVEHRVGAENFRRTGELLPPSVVHDCLQSDAVLLAAFGLPDVRRPDGTEVQPEFMVGLRRVMDLYAAVRPIKLYPGVPSCLRETGPGIDFIVLRENSEGLFASYNGGAQVGSEVAADTMLITRRGTERVAEYAFRLAARRNGRPTDGRRMVTCVDKANIFRSMAFFRSVFHDVAKRHPEIATDAQYVDAMSLYMVQRPWDFDVLVMENMYGDILSDLGAGLVGGLGLGPSAEIGPGPALFQPSHGSAPAIAGQGIANPMAMILSAGMMLDWLGAERGDEAAARAGKQLEAAVARALLDGSGLTADVGGSAGTEAAAEAVLQRLAAGVGQPAKTGRP